jgi:hypothetical protein
LQLGRIPDNPTLCKAKLYSFGNCTAIFRSFIPAREIPREYKGPGSASFEIERSSSNPGNLAVVVLILFRSTVTNRPTRVNGPFKHCTVWVLWRNSTRGVACKRVFAYAEAMEVHFAPDVQAKLDRLVSETGRAPDKLLEDAMAGYDLELAETREMLDSRYDDLKSGRVKPIPGEEVVAYFREKSADARRSQPGS